MGAALLRQSANGRLALGRAAGIVAPDLVPPPLRPLAATLERAREEASGPLPAKVVERALRDAWGRPPGRVLDALDPAAPVAVTPLAQVHRGELDGEPVAVRLRRPGLDAAVRADLALLDGLRPPLAALLPRLDTGALLGQLREQALDELDLEHEAAQQRAVRRAVARVDDVVVPAVHTELAAPAVSVSAWLDGPSLAARAPADPDRVARALVDAHLAAARAGLIMIDARPGHVLALRGGRTGLLGAGVAVAADRSRIAALLALPEALQAADPAAFAALLHGELALLPDPAHAAAAHALLREVLGEVVDGELGPAALEGAAERGLDRIGPLLGLMAAATPEPRDLLVARGAGQLAGVLAALA